MEDFVGFIVVLIAVSVMFVCAVVLAAAMLGLLLLYGLMHVSAWVYTRATGHSWDVPSGNEPGTRTP